MTITAARSAFLLALVPLLLLGSLRPSSDAGAGVRAADVPQARLQLASLKAEARAMSVHIDGP